MKLIDMPSFGERTVDGIEQETRVGSFGRAPAPDCRSNFFLALNMRTLRTIERKQCLFGLLDKSQDNHVTLCLSGNELVVDAGGYAISTGVAITPLSWWSVGLGIDMERHQAVLELVALHPRLGPSRKVRKSFDLGRLVTMPQDGWANVSFGALDASGDRLHFDGQLEAPAIGAGELPDLAAIGGSLKLPRDRCLAAWDFSGDMTTQSFPDRGPSRLGGEFVNLPTRAMRGSNWSGHAMAWMAAQGEYGAVHFHSDDVGDAGWTKSCVVKVPEGAPSGVYALVAENDLGQDLIPFYVLPDRNRTTDRRIVFLASTMTYLAYANHARSNWKGQLEERASRWKAYPHNPDTVTNWGFSTYNYHPDGSGVALSSRRRPILTMRPGYLTFPDAKGSGLRHFPADTHLLDWLEEKGHAFDVITDEDLDEHGVDILRPYSVVITGSHPEYHTEAMLDGLEQFRAEGGRICYMGGNGFYWRIARSPDLPWVLEIRRAESGIRAWASEPGEYYNQLDGSYGGLWRRNGRPPQKLVEIGFAVQGLFEGCPYYRTAESYAPEVSWIFDGVSENVFGDFGLSGGGAAGFELDQVSPSLGTSPGTVVLARSAGHGPSFLGVPEDILTHTLAAGGKVEVEAHLVYSDKDGEVFATGSITFLGSLSHNGYDNSVSRLFDNVLRRFSQPR
ncbi:N,N-dimethylformamidase beta subunit family domain-containing protein [Mesorhizobium shangrilense]|uniref:N,N-dimethylformamidase beta subunit family domain-containing protein n=1 Tax=Mesorhizobium shangrilense TaxID=460060 RepID=A0ABV2DGX0_9HYPH